MKKLLLLSIIATLCYSCSAQTKNFDLEKVTFKEDYKTLTAGHQRSGDHDILTTLPEFEVYDAVGYSFGPVNLEGESTVEILLNNEKERKTVGMIIRFETTRTARAAQSYVFNQYHKPTRVLQKETKQLDHENKPYLSPSAFLWQNIRPGVSMILSKSYMIENGKPLEEVELVILENDVQTKFPTTFKTALNKALATFTVSQ